MDTSIHFHSYPQYQGYLWISMDIYIYTNFINGKFISIHIPNNAYLVGSLKLPTRNIFLGWEIYPLFGNLHAIYVFLFAKFMWVLSNGWFIIETPAKMDDLGYHIFFFETSISR